MRLATLLALGAAFSLGCSSDGTGPGKAVQTIHVTPESVRFNAIGNTAQLQASALDRDGNPWSDVAFSWASADTAVATVTGNGLVRARGNGTVSVSASAEGKTTAVTVVVEQVATTLTPNTAASTMPVGGTLQLGVTAADSNGAAIPQPTVAWSSSNPAVASVGASTGVVTGHAIGEATITATMEGLSATIALEVMESTAPWMSAIAPATLTPGASATLGGTGFSPIAGENIVTVDGVAAAVTAATATQLTIQLPARSAFSCQPTRAVTVSVAVHGLTGTRQHPLAVANQHTLAPGESVILLNGGDARCNELAQGGGSYLVSVFNTSTTASATSSFQLRGAGGGAAPATATATAGTLLARGAAPAAKGRPAPQLVAWAREGEAHHRILEQNRRLAERLGPHRRGAGVRPRAALDATGVTGAAPPPPVGAILAFRVPDIDAADACATFKAIEGRVVYSGTRAVVVEDVAAPLAGTMDAHFQAIGAEFDQTMYPVLTQYFGNPLALDEELDNDGRIVMLFSRAVNDMEKQVAGFVFSGDLFDRSQCASSDTREVFYATVPTSAAAGYGAGTIDYWKWTMRSTVVHEVKHITSFAERLSRGATAWEESWLEESTARISEELWARTVFGYAQGDNTGYQASLYCEARPSRPECAGKPVVMRKHFGAVYNYMADVENLTPLRSPDDSASTFYGSGWLLVRWATDQFGASDAAFLGDLTQEPHLAGVANLEARTGKSFAELLGNWSLSLYMDDHPAATRPELQHPSWNTRDIFQGMHTDFPDAFPNAHPLLTHSVPFGTFLVDAMTVRAGTAALFTLSGVQGGTQLLELRSPAGGAPAPALRLAIVRVN